MEKLFEGPVQEWKPDAHDVELIESMLASENELMRAYGEAYQNACWVREFGDGDDGRLSGLAAVGDLNRLAEIEFRTGMSIDQNNLTLGDCIGLGAFPGSGNTRAERVRDGMCQVLEAREQALSHIA